MLRTNKPVKDYYKCEKRCEMEIDCAAFTFRSILPRQCSFTKCSIPKCQLKLKIGSKYKYNPKYVSAKKRCLDEEIDCSFGIAIG